MGEVTCANCGTVLASEASREARACRLCGTVQQLGCRVCGIRIRPGAATCLEHSAAVVSGPQPSSTPTAPRAAATTTTMERPLAVTVREDVGARKGRRHLWIAGAAAAAVLAGVTFTFALGGDEAPPERRVTSATIRKGFLDRCVRAGGNVDGCACVLGRGERLYSLEQFVRLERQLFRTGRVRGHDDLTSGCDFRLAAAATAVSGGEPRKGEGPCASRGWRTPRWFRDC